MSKIITDIRENLKKVHVYPSVKVSPSIAKELLELNTNNRPVKARTAKLYTEQMKKGEWIFNGDLIRISITGVILDGQHRLLSVVASGTTQEWNIQTGLPDETFDKIDIGKNRSSGDVMAIAGYKNSTILSAAIKIVIAYDNRNLKYNKNVETHKRPTNHDLIEWMEKKNDELMIICVENGSRYSKTARFLSAGSYSALCYIFSRKNRIQAASFFDKLTTGEGISSKVDSPIYVLRQKLINFMGTEHKIEPTNKYAIIIRAWNLYRAGKEAKRISWSSDEDFPKAE